MEQRSCTKEIAIATNRCFEREVSRFLCTWVLHNEEKTLLRFDQTLEQYLLSDALRDFFLNTQHPLQELLQNPFIAYHLGRSAEAVYFDPLSGDPLLAITEQRIYNLARRMESEHMHVPFRSIHPNKQTDAGDLADINTYPSDSEEIRYNSGNHFASRPANNNVFDENSKRCLAKANSNLHIVFKRGYLEDRLKEIREVMICLNEEGETQMQFFVIYSRHSITEGHFGTSVVVMDPAKPHFPVRVLVCDTLLKELPQHPRWWNHFIAEYSQVFGDAIAEIVEDLSHPLQKVNVKGDDPYRHDWNCPYYAASMADALADLITLNRELFLSSSLADIYEAMKDYMSDYYQKDREIRDRYAIQEVNRLKRWNSGSQMIRNLEVERIRNSSYEL